jgi:general secretion pathway protein K
MRAGFQMKRGSTLVAVFWLMSILSLAVFTAVRLLYYEVDLVTSQVHGSRARQVAEMGSRWGRTRW